MATNSRMLSGIGINDVWSVLCDAHSYQDWVVGTRAVRSADPDWPRPGSRLHYTVGYGPLRKDDETMVLGCVADEALTLQARAWPAGSARIEITTQVVPEGVRVQLVEHPDQGLAKLLHNPVLDLAIKLRNVETLRRLDSQARRRKAAR